MSAGIIQRSNSSQKRCEEQCQFVERLLIAVSKVFLVESELAARKTLAKRSGLAREVVPGARPGAAPLQEKVVFDPFTAACCALQLTAAFRLATLLQDGHHIFSARRGPHHEGGTVQLPDKQGIIRLARDLQKRARIGAARALVVVLVPVPACSLSRRSGSATRRGRGARVRRRLHSSLRPCSFPGKDRGARRVRPENEWWFVLAQFMDLQRYGGGTTEDVPGIAKINQVTRSIECCYP